MRKNWRSSTNSLGTDAKFGRNASERRRTVNSPNFQPLIDRWGGVTLFYRKGIDQAPAYRQNHEEIVKALEEGIALAEGMNPSWPLLTSTATCARCDSRSAPMSQSTAVAQPCSSPPGRRRTPSTSRSTRARSRWTASSSSVTSRAGSIARSSSRPCTTRAGPRSAGRRRSRPIPRTASTSAYTATTTPCTPATSSKPWPAPRMGIRTSSSCTKPRSVRPIRASSEIAMHRCALSFPTSTIFWSRPSSPSTA